jgi:hypothetical protein
MAAAPGYWLWSIDPAEAAWLLRRNKFVHEFVPEADDYHMSSALIWRRLHG